MNEENLYLSDKHLEQFIDLFFHLTGNRISKGKKEFVERRLAQRMITLGLKSVNDYFRCLDEMGKYEIPYFIHALTIHTTTFFRNPKQYDFLTEHALPEFVKNNSLNRTFHVWCGACSTGEEAYSVAMAIEAWKVKNKVALNYKIFASDIDDIVLEEAKNAVYPARRGIKIPANYKNQFLKYDKHSPSQFFRIKENLIDKITWNQNNLLSEAYNFPPSLKFDIIFINNVFIYFSPLEIKKATERMKHIMRDDAHLVLGAAENLYRVETGLETLKPGISIKRAQKKELNIFEKREVKAPIGPIKVMLVDDSKLIHSWVTKALGNHRDIRIVAQAYDGEEALAILASKQKKVDVIVSDIQMPKMDGITLLEKQMKLYQIPTLMLSTLSRDDGELGIKAYELGAVDYIEKPTQAESVRIEQELADKIRMAAVITSKNNNSISNAPVSNEVLEKKLILIGASTGGPMALRKLLTMLPKNCPPIVVIQHMPEAFTYEFARSLNGECHLTVAEAINGQKLELNHVYIAKGGLHLRLKESKGHLELLESNIEKVNGHKPSVDFLFKSSVALTKNYDITAVLLTGMGADGAEGMKLLKDNGAYTIGQSRQSSVIYGMAKVAKELGGVDREAPLIKIAGFIESTFNRRGNKTLKQAS